LFLSVLNYIEEQKKLVSKQLAVLIDPDDAGHVKLDRMLQIGEPDLWLVGGSMIYDGSVEETVHLIRKKSQKPCVIFPASPTHISSEADAFLLLSLMSGRNPDLLVGKHVEAAMMLKRSGLEIIPTAYLLIDGGITTTAHFVSQTMPLPNHKPALAASTALAAEQLGMKLVYLDSGSGARQPVSESLIKAVRQAVDLPIVTGGGIKSAEQAYAAWQSGSDVVVVGNALEDNPDFLTELLETRSLFQS
jgi:phosphoglycerol geranylgeranyltransferase